MNAIPAYPSPPRGVALVATVMALVVGCGSGIGTQPVPSSPPESGAASGSSPELRASSPGTPPSPAATMSVSPSASTSAVPSSAPGVLVLCANDPSTPPSDIDCRDAVVAAMAAADLGSVPIRASLRWSRRCPTSTTCPSEPPDPNVAYVEVDLPDGSGIEVAVRLQNGGLVAGPASALTAADVGPRPTVASPDVSKADLGPAPSWVIDRPALPFCGTENAGLAGPFNGGGRRCFLDSVVAGAPAEFASHRTDVGGAPFVEVWRSTGSGSVTVLLDQDSRWSELTCGLTILPGTDQLFDHTDCAVKAIR